MWALRTASPSPSTARLLSSCSSTRVTTAAAFQSAMAATSRSRSRSHAPVAAEGCFLPGQKVSPTLPSPGPAGTSAICRGWLWLVRIIETGSPGTRAGCSAIALGDRQQLSGAARFFHDFRLAGRSARWPSCIRAGTSCAASSATVSRHRYSAGLSASWRHGDRRFTGWPCPPLAPLPSRTRGLVR